MCLTSGSLTRSSIRSLQKPKKNIRYRVAWFQFLVPHVAVTALRSTLLMPPCVPGQLNPTSTWVSPWYGKLRGRVINSNPIGKNPSEQVHYRQVKRKQRPARVPHRMCTTPHVYHRPRTQPSRLQSSSRHRGAYAGSAYLQTCVHGRHQQLRHFFARPPLAKNFHSAPRGRMPPPSLLIPQLHARV